MADFQIWNHGLAELPVATVRPHEPRARALAMLGDLRRWLALRWDWFRPRTVPVLFAAIGMVFVLLSADYLAHAHGANHAPKVDTFVIRLR